MLTCRKPHLWAPAGVAREREENRMMSLDLNNIFLVSCKSKICSMDGAKTDPRRTDCFERFSMDFSICVAFCTILQGFFLLALWVAQQ